MNRYAKFGGAARRHFSICEKPMGGGGTYVPPRPCAGIRHTAPEDTNHRGTCSRIHCSHTATAAGQSAHSDSQELLRPTPVAASRLSAHAQPEFIPHAETIPSTHHQAAISSPHAPRRSRPYLKKKNIRKHHRRSASTQHGTRVVQL